MRIFNLLSLMMLLGHWNGCLQFLVPMLQGFPSNSWVAINKLELAGPGELYTWSLFKALSHMLCIGYGRFPPQNSTDVWLTMLSIMTGATCYALLVGHATTVIQSFDTSKKLYRQKLKLLEEYMIHRKLPLYLRKKIGDYYENRFQGKVFDEAAILAELNDSLKDEVMSYTSRTLISTIQLFAHADPNFVSDIISRLQHEVFQPGNYVIKEGTRSKKMYFIQEGNVDIIKNNEVITSLVTGSYFGEIGLFTEGNRVASVRSETYCSLYSLSKEHFDIIMEQYPLLKQKMESVAAQRLYKLGLNKVTNYQEKLCDDNIRKLREILMNTPHFGSINSVHSLDGALPTKKKKSKKQHKHRKDRNCTQNDRHNPGVKESIKSLITMTKSRSASSRLEDTLTNKDTTV